MGRKGDFFSSVLEDWKIPKIEVAKQALTALLDRLRPDDQLGIVLFNNNAETFQALTVFGDLESDVLNERISQISDGGGTNMSSGMRLGTRMLEDVGEIDPATEENRIVFLTDAQPNRGILGRGELTEVSAANAEQRINTTYVGVGVDFNTDLIESIGTIKGANYFSVHSPDGFRQRMDSGFDHMVHPLIFDLEVKLSGAEMERVYGSPQADESTGTVLKVATLFPSETVGGEVRGGVILAKMASPFSSAGGEPVRLTVSYKDRVGKEFTGKTDVNFGSPQTEVYPGAGFRKAVVLTRYATLLRDWIASEREVYATLPETNELEELEIILGQWERTSFPLFVSRIHRERMRLFRRYLRAEMKQVGDPTLERELTVLDQLIGDHRSE